MSNKKTIHPAVVDGMEVVEQIKEKAKKAVKVETPEEREERLRLAREERENRKEEEEWREMMAPARRKAAAKALWAMYRNGELIKQTIGIGSFEQVMLYSHHSKFAKE